jgi:uncharacterized protein
MRRWCFLIVLAAITGALPFAGDRLEAASFDCRKPASPVEHLICENAELRQLDSQTEGAYQGALDRSNNSARVKETQKTWLQQRNACVDEKCLTAAYSKQIDLLSAISDEPPACRGGSSQEIDACAAEQSRRANLELTRYVAAARQRLLDEARGSSNGRSIRRALAQFKASQTAWEAHRKAECGAMLEWGSTGSVRGLMAETCWLTVTKARSLSIWNNWLQFMDGSPPLMPKPSEK